MQALERELRFHFVNNGRLPVNSVYIGGGTPSILTAQHIRSLSKMIQSSFDVSSEAEITLEVNPSSVTIEKVHAWRDASINRVSLGVQSFCKEHLEILGRTHGPEDVERDLGLLRSNGIRNINIDMIYAIPTQSLADWKREVDLCLAHDPTHISAYSLIIEPHTYMHRLVKENKRQPIEDDLQTMMVQHINQRLQSSGWHLYEVSNYAKPGYESIHNQKYWKCRPTLGFGLGAHSFTGSLRYANTRNLNHYIRFAKTNQFVVEQMEIQTLEQRRKDYIMMNMRLFEGFSLEEYQAEFHESFIERYEEIIQRYTSLGFLEIVNGRISFTEKGMYISNRFFIEVI